MVTEKAPPLLHQTKVTTAGPFLGPLAISDPHINICVGPPKTCVALEQFNLLSLNTLL